jgi:RNA polymerase sigma-70 factor (ECF subfamily)
MPDSDLLAAAQQGDEQAFSDLVEAYRAELTAHCYRMLGSYHDAEDAVQDALLRAWRALPAFEGRASVRSWLHSIVTNTAIDIARRRARRALVHAPAVGPGAGPGGLIDEPTWLEPFPDHMVGDIELTPEARYEQRESLELAFVVALQHLPPMQRAVLILREVAGFSAQELASQLDTSVSAVNSALQRARASVQGKLPARSQQATLRSLGDHQVKVLAGRYADAIENGDTDGLVSMLTSDATWSMPPDPTWYAGRSAITEFVRDSVFMQDWRHLATHANGQLAVGCYIFDPASGRYNASVLDVITLDGDKISAVVGFLTADLLRRSGHEVKCGSSDFFPLFGLPPDLPKTLAAPGKRACYQDCLVAGELLLIEPTISRCVKTDCMAIRPGPSSVSHTDLACHRAEENQYRPRGYSKCRNIRTEGSFQISPPGWMQIRSPGLRSRTNELPGQCRSSSPGMWCAVNRSMNLPSG